VNKHSQPKAFFNEILDRAHYQKLNYLAIVRAILEYALVHWDKAAILICETMY